MSAVKKTAAKTATQIAAKTAAAKKSAAAKTAAKKTAKTVAKKNAPCTLKILGNMGGSCARAYSTSALLDDSVLLDAGTGALTLSVGEMRGITDVLLTHAHLDHTAMLFFLLDCRIGDGGAVRVHCLRETADAIRRGILNNEIWPDFEKLRINGRAVMEFCYVRPYKTFVAGGRRITPLPVIHAVPTVGYCLHGNREDFVYIADIFSAPPAAWRYLKNLRRFRRMTAEISFPDGMDKVARDSFHLTPGMLEGLLKNISPRVEVFYCHTKPQVSRQVAADVKKRFGKRVRPLRRGEVFYL